MIAVHSLRYVMCPWIVEMCSCKQVSFIFCIVTLLNVPIMHTSVPHSWGLLRLLAKSWYPCKLTTYLMQHTLIATSERFFIRYCAALQSVPSLAQSFREKTLQQSCQGRATTRDGCAVTITCRQLILPLNTLICSHLPSGLGQVMLFINHTVSEWLGKRRHTLLKKKNKCNTKCVFLF